MKKLGGLLVFCLALIATAATVADSPSAPKLQPSAAACEQLKQEGVSAEQFAKRGCCSWHGGVCDCYGGRVVCCDNSFSPSCTCNSEDSTTVAN